MAEKKLSTSEIIAALGGLLLAVSVFVKAYEARPQNPNANIDGMRGTLSIWQVHDIMRFLLLLAALAPIILVYIVIRDHQLSWPRGEMTAVVGLTAATLIFYTGIIDRPGEPSGEIELEWGWYVALAGTVLMLGGAALRATETERRRKPPGTI